MENQSDLVAEGKWIHEHSYGRRSERYKEIDLGDVKIDFFDVRTRMVHETKKSNKREYAHVAQLKYYIYKLEEAGIDVKGGILEYPKLREREEVFLSDTDRNNILLWVRETQDIMNLDVCPVLEKKSLCKRCAYHDFCFSNETCLP